MTTFSRTAIYNFIHAVNILPDDSRIPSAVEEALAPALRFETALRQHFVHNNLSDPYIGLIDVFDTPSHFRKSRPRTVDNAADLKAHYLFPLSDQHRRIVGSPSCVADMATFMKRWLLFTHGVLEQFSDWDNVVVGGGSVLAALVQTTAQTDNELCKLYFSNPYSSADVDIFLWGLSPFEAENKICAIFDAVKASVPWDVVAVRKANVISIHTQYPCRHIQIILRLYQSPTEILVGFDIDSSSVCFDGKHVWATPRSMASILTQINTVDMTRRSPSYEIRLVKYARRGWEISYPALRRGDLNLMLYNQDLAFMPTGLARLLVLEKFFSTDRHYYYIRFPGKPVKQVVRDNFTLTVEDDHEGFDSNYDYAPFHIPFALAWDAKRVKMLVKRTEERMSTLYNPVNAGRYLHQHVMVAFDNIQDCFSNVCGTCPLPRNEDEAEEQRNNDTRYIRGRLRFMTTNAGQQMISGSFNPINDSEWETGAYVL
ncbi:hypothetical protein BJ912DRAFT_969815 [Pholiota molesta]|nr:hypothetical protein BJ912DRAFT_969815 [Pholiota molesta]